MKRVQNEKKMNSKKKLCGSFIIHFEAPGHVGKNVSLIEYHENFIPRSLPQEKEVQVCMCVCVRHSSQDKRWKLR